jgi:triphosphoribosyl-dephospho-CoA synthetase
VQGALNEQEYSNNLLQTLIYIVGTTDDNVRVKRSKTFDNYLKKKQMIASVDADNPTQVSIVNQKCLQSNLSIGGSADVLVATVFMLKIKELIHLNFSK